MRVSTNEDKRGPNVFAAQADYIKTQQAERDSKAGAAPTPDIWKKQPTHRTKTALDKTRKQNLQPHPSYDIDGDGVVSAYDLFIASKFDWDRDGRLNTAERRNVDQALKDGFADKMAQAHALQKSTIGGRLYKSLYLDNVQPDPNALTRTQLMETRKKDLMSDLAQKYEPQRQKQFDAFNSRLAGGKEKKKATASRKNLMTLRKAETLGRLDDAEQGDHMKSVNGHRVEPSGTRVESPPIKTRRELLTQRKQADMVTIANAADRHLGRFKTTHERVMEQEEARLAERLVATPGRTKRDVDKERKASGAATYNKLQDKKALEAARDQALAVEYMSATMHSNSDPARVGRTRTALLQERHPTRHSAVAEGDPMKTQPGHKLGISLHTLRGKAGAVGPLNPLRAPAPPLPPRNPKGAKNTGFSSDLLNRKRMQKFLKAEKVKSSVPLMIDVTGSGGMFSSFSDDKVFHPPQLPKLEQHNQAVSLARVKIERARKRQEQETASYDPDLSSTVDRPYTAPDPKVSTVSMKDILTPRSTMTGMTGASTARGQSGGSVTFGNTAMSGTTRSLSASSIRHSGFQTLRDLGKLY